MAGSNAPVGDSETAFSPRTIVVPVGSTVTWTNEDRLPHIVSSGVSDGRTADPDGRFDSGLIDPGGTFSQSFDASGVFDYFCTPHPWMRGTVTVQDV